MSVGGAPGPDEADSGDVLHGVDDVRSWVDANVFDPDPDAPRRGKVGLEVELFPFWVRRDGSPAARLALVEMMAVLDDVARRDRDSSDGRPSWHRDGILITEEPGAQLELAGPPDVDATAALDRVEGLLAVLRSAFAEAGAQLVSAGLDLWSDPEEVPVQLDIPRYDAMSSYFEARGGRHGHLLMCASCSIQVNLDLGPPDVARRRWRVANLAAPVITAAFAASPTGRAANGRAMGWRQLDPTRTGVAPPFVAGSDGAVDHVTADALRADVMMVARGGDWYPGEPGWTFERWLRDGHDRFGAPSSRDLEIHLTTLFPEARLRGFLEVRTVDALPAPWRSAAVALVTALFYDQGALEHAATVLSPIRRELPDLLERAAEEGLADPVIGPLAVEVLEAAADGVARVEPSLHEATEGFLDRFTREGRAPSDELREALAEGGPAAFRWASR